MPFLAWRRPSLVSSLCEAVAVLGQVDHVGRGAEDRHVGVLQRAGELQRRLPAELHDDAGSVPFDCSTRTISSTSSAVSGSK